MPIYKVKGESKDGLQKYRVRVNYTDRNGKAHSITRIEYGAAEAKILESKLIDEYTAKGAPTAPTRITVQMLYNEYIIAKKSEVRETSLIKIKENIESTVLPYFSNQRLDKLNSKQLQTWKNTLFEKDLALTTLQNAYSHFHSLLNFAVRMDYISKNPLNSIGNFKDVYFKKPQEKLHYYKPDEYFKYITVAKEYAASKTSLVDWGYYVFFSIAFYTGARKGEINALKWSDIDGNVIHIRRSISQKQKGKDIESPPKNKSSYRDIQMPLPLIEILKEHKLRQQQDKNFTEDYRVCGGVAPLRDTSIENHNKYYAKQADLPHIRIHDFRHTHASFLANNGINIQEIARRLGHSNVQQTWQTYAHLYPKEEERAVDLLNSLGQSQS